MRSRATARRRTRGASTSSWAPVRRRDGRRDARQSKQVALPTCTNLPDNRRSASTSSRRSRAQSSYSALGRLSSRRQRRRENLAGRACSVARLSPGCPSPRTGIAEAFLFFRHPPRAALYGFPGPRRIRGSLSRLGRRSPCVGRPAHGVPVASCDVLTGSVYTCGSRQSGLPRGLRNGVASAPASSAARARPVWRERRGGPSGGREAQDARWRVRSVCVREARRRELGDFDSGFGRPVGCGGDFAADLVVRGDFAADLVVRFADPRSCLAFSTGSLLAS